MPAMTRPLGYIAIIYWLVFWLMNGLDKFMHGTSVTAFGQPLFTWYGKDRLEQFGRYFDRIDWDPAWIPALLTSCGVIELAASALFFVAFLGTRHTEQWLGAAFATSTLIFMGFSTWDVVVGDRAELLEHGTYIGVVFITAAFLAVTQFRPASVLSSVHTPRGKFSLAS